MLSHKWLPLLAMVTVMVTISAAQLDISLGLASNPRFNKMLLDSPKPTELDKSNESKIPLAEDPRFNKMLQDSPKPTEGESLRDTKIPLAEDPRFNKMLQESQKLSVDKSESTTPSQPTTTSEEDDYYEDDNYDYDDEDDEYEADLQKTENKTSPPTEKSVVSQSTATTKVPITSTTQQISKLELIKDKNTFEDEKTLNSNTLDDDEDDDDDDADDMSSEEDDDDDIDVSADELSCPRDCICERNLNNYLVATCNRLDLGIQKFTSDITDLQVIGVSAKYPIVLSAEFFKKIGLSHVSSIKIVDSSIETIHPSAFDSLDELYSVNLTNSGIELLHPDTFSRTTKLRLLTLAGNDLHAMQQKISPFADYMLKAPSVEELDISRCNLKQILPTAFSKLENVVYINLAENQLKTLPTGLFDKVETIEELDLSLNSISDLPKNIFNRTALSILNLKYNQITTHLDFITPDLQKLDLSYNKMININGQMFDKMTGLSTLILKGNSIRKIHHTAFSHLKNLRHVDLSFNNLEQVSALMFLNNRDLDVIRMNDNPSLKKLPLDGFESETGSFNVYHFDVSNCDISELGDNTFSTMSQLTILKLAWNNIDSLGNGVFSYLNRLVELDLSNNVLVDLSDLIFLHNRELKKLNLAGNPIGSLSSRVFLPTEELIELDISDCSLTKIWKESSPTARATNVFKSLRSLNVSHNDIKHVYESDLSVMENLDIFDIQENPLECDVGFKNLIKWLSLKKVKSDNPNNIYGHNAKMVEASYFTETFEKGWNELARSTCSHTRINNDVIDSNDSDDDDSMDDIDILDDDIIDNIDSDGKTIANGKESKVKKGEKILSTKTPAIQNIGFDYDEDEDEDDESYDESEMDDDEDLFNKNEPEIALESDKGLAKDSLDVDPVKPSRLPNIVDSYDGDINDDDDDDDDDESLYREVYYRPHRLAYFGQTRYWMPILIIVLCVACVLLLVAKVVSIMMRRRGERYRQALLASKNSIVYQKLTEDIGPTTPKFHRYAPINQV